jgi:hypothetical protein
MTSREQIFAALFALASTATGFVTKSRTLRGWVDVAPPDQPAFFQVEGKQHAQSQPGVGTKWTFHAELVVYAHQANTVNGADLVSVLNAQVDALVATLAPGPAGDPQTLGGRVTDVRIDGDIETSEGRLGEQAVAIIPVIIIATN